MSEVPFSRPRKRTISFNKTNSCFDIVDNLSEIIAKTPCLDRKVSFNMDSPTITAVAGGATNPFQSTENDDFWNSLDLFNDDALNSTDCGQHIKEEIHEMDFAITKVKDEQFKDLGDLTDMWPFGADDNMDGSSAVDDLFGSDLVDSIIKCDTTKQEEEQQVIQSDLMWSSTLDKDMSFATGFDSAPFKRGRRRDVSLTLSECAEGLLAVKDMELMSTSPLLGSSPMIGSQPTHNAFFMETPLASSESDTETGVSGDSEEEEIDVEKVQDHDELSSSRTRVHYRKHHNNHKHNHSLRNGNTANIAPGRSLLKSRHNQHQKQQKHIKQEQQLQQQQQQRSSTPSIDHMFGDHSYFLVRPAPGSTGSDSKDYSDVYSDDEGQDKNDGNRFGGMLTPTESGDEAEDRLKGTFTAATISTPTNIDKRKIAQAVQSLIKNRSLNASDGQTAKAAANALAGHKSTDVKFRFRMRFKSTNSQHSKLHQKSLLNINNRPSLSTNNNNHHQDYHRTKRRSASKNPHCPTPPVSDQDIISSEQSTIDSITTGTATMLTAPASNRQQRQQLVSPYYISGASPINQHQSTLSSNGSNHSSSNRRSLLNSNNTSNRLSQEEKCREIRDLHNSMERQRRVDLRKNFDMLKVCVPELADVEKASKLNILNKAADYCRLLVSLDAKFKKEAEKEEQKNATLKKKLEGLMNQLDNGTRLSSGRLSVLQGRNRMNL